MHDDGLNGDEVAGDGVYEATFEPTHAGTYTLRGVFEGVLPDGVTAYRRTTEHLMPVVVPDVELSGWATAAWGNLKSNATASREQLDFFIGVSPAKGRVEGTQGPKYRAYAEVYGSFGVQDSDQKPSCDIPIGWISQMVDVETNAEGKEGFGMALDAGTPFSSLSSRVLSLFYPLLVSGRRLDGRR